MNNRIADRLYPDSYVSPGDLALAAQYFITWLVLFVACAYGLVWAVRWAYRRIKTNN